MEYIVGDRVMVDCGAYLGELGTLTAVNGEKVTVDFDSSDDVIEMAEWKVVHFTS
jgi:transcription elongation factor